MSSIIDFLKGRKNKRPTIIVPATFGTMEEAKISTVYDSKDRFINKRINARAKHSLVYQKQDGTAEKSVGDEMIRHAVEETAYYGGLLGEETPLTRDQYVALMQHRRCVESIQQEYGVEYPFFQTVARGLRVNKDIIEAFTVTRPDVDIERVTVSPNSGTPFSGMNVNLDENLKNLDKDTMDKLVEISKNRAKELEKK